jgi:type III secretory pathway component EscV
LDQIQAAIRTKYPTKLGSLAPAIVTASSIRAFVRKLVADELPGARVFSYDEIDVGPDIRVQLIAEISVS